MKKWPWRNIGRDGYRSPESYAVAALGAEWARRGEEFTSAEMLHELLRRLNLTNLITTEIPVGATYAGEPLDAAPAVMERLQNRVAWELGKTYPDGSPRWNQRPDPTKPERYLYLATIHVTTANHVRDHASMYARIVDDNQIHREFHRVMAERMEAVGGETTEQEMLELGLAPNLQEVSQNLAQGLPADSGF